MLESLKRRGVTEPDAMAKSLARYQAFRRRHQDFDDSRALFDWCCRQTHIALGNMMTGVAMACFDSCPLEVFNYAAMERVLSGSLVCSMRQNGAVRRRDIRLPRSGNANECAQALGRNRYLCIR